MIMESLLFTSAALVAIGLYMVSTKRNLMKIVIGLEILATGVNLSFIAMGFIRTGGLTDPLPQAIVVTAIVLDGVLVGVALALTLVVFRRFKTLDVDKLRNLRW